MGELNDAMAAARGRWTSNLLKEWYSPSQLRANLAAAVQPEAERVGDLQFGAAFRDNLATIDVSDASAWANRRLDLGDGHWCVTGIRYRALDRTRPFVDVVATSLAPKAASLARLAEKVLPHYEQFGPRAIRVDAPDPDPLIAGLITLPEFSGASVDQYLVAGQVADLIALPSRSGFDRVTLASVGIDEAVSMVAQCYTQLEQHNADLRLWATPSSAEELQEPYDQGLLFRIEVDGAPAGIVAARRDDDHAMTGFVVQEIVLADAYLGQRLAAPVQQHLARRLPATEGDTLWGSVHPENRPSLRNALSIGRRVVGAYVWLTPTGLRGI